MALPYEDEAPGIPNLPAQSDADVQRFLVQWTDQLLKKNTKLNELVEMSEKQTDELRALLSIKDDDIEKLQAKVKDLRRKSSHDPQILALKEEVAGLKSQVATANTIALEHKERIERQNTQLTVIYRSKMDEKNRLEQQIQKLQQLAAKPKMATSPAPAAFLPTPRPYVSALSRAIGREPPPQAATAGADPRYAALEAAAKDVIEKVGPMMALDFGGVGAVLKKLKHVIEEQDTKKEE
jgi:hypothetical protein